MIGSVLIDETTRTGRIDFVNFQARRTRWMAASAALLFSATLKTARFTLIKDASGRAGRAFPLIVATNWQLPTETLRIWVIAAP